MTRGGPAEEPYLAYLDSLRGIAALGVAVFAHYVIFSGLYQPGGLPRAAVPLYGFAPARLLYLHAAELVEFFFVISGIIFHHVYREKLRSRSVDGRTFFWARFSRLYPLHLATLLLCAALAFGFAARFGRFPVYAINDAKHFLLNLVFLQRGYFDNGYSFNGPAWSLSVETTCYVLFFLIARTARPRVLAGSVMALGLVMLATNANRQFFWNVDIARGLFGFFLGFLTYDLFAPGRFWRGATILAAALALVIAAGLLLKSHAHGSALESAAVSLFSALLILVIQHHPRMRAPLEWRFSRLLGEASLSLYLMHIPLGMTMLWLMTAMGWRPPLDQAWFLLLWIGLVVALALVTFRVFERPSKRLLRRLTDVPARRAVW